MGLNVTPRWTRLRFAFLRGRAIVRRSRLIPSPSGAALPFLFQETCVLSEKENTFQKQRFNFFNMMCEFVTDCVRSSVVRTFSASSLGTSVTARVPLGVLESSFSRNISVTSLFSIVTSSAAVKLCKNCVRKWF